MAERAKQKNEVPDKCPSSNLKFIVTSFRLKYKITKKMPPKAGYTQKPQRGSPLRIEQCEAVFLSPKNETFSS